MSKIFPRNCKVTLPVACSGEGVYIIDSNGKQYIDASGGAAVSCLGHGDPDIAAPIKQQLDRLEFAHTGFFTTDIAESLAALLVENAPGDIDRVYLVSGGSEAVEAAIKLARQYYVEIGEPQRDRVIARLQSYHGNTLGALAAGGNLWRRQQFDPLLTETTHISPCYAYRGKLENETAFEYGQRVANELEQQIQALGEDRVMAFIAEPVVGATLGAVPAVEGYFKRIREICDQYGVLLILDEVMCGMGRTGSLFAYEQEGIHPDIVTIAKGLGAGYQPVGAMLCTDKIYRTIEQGSGFFQHGHTYLGHPVACAAAQAVLSTLVSENYPERVLKMGSKLMQALHDRFDDHPHVGDIRGRGLFQGIELVADRDSKQAFDPGRGINKRIKQGALNGGLVCYPMGGTVDGRQGDHVLLAPPFIIEDQHVVEIVDKLEKAINEAIA